ncbi:hypothetical protein PV10_08054 [Exophiala mesophila]|uniref:Auxin efflux carrier n=1 Tax=Exophiala mesophila TaxID=212818 RepID=A0A0D1ZNJ3_EXOME|nr:uncharacterized protein PV10_08054 [Exophiala mesophila]KIV88363.1 hypothetical protein PV10_08054 [Exophiala mesophila]
MASTGLVESFVSAVQASLSVLLVISYGGIAAYLNLLDSKTTKAISKICVRMFLPALLMVQIGSELHAGAAHRYLLIFAWALICHAISFLIGIFAHLFMGMPDWITAAIMFNNTTSYPLLLIAALQDTGVLEALIMPDETARQAVERAKSYFLVFATVSSCLTFAVGPRLIDSEHGHDSDKISQDSESHSSGDVTQADETTGLLPQRESLVQFSDPFRQNSFFPSLRKRSQTRVRLLPDRRASVVPQKHWATLGPRSKWWLLFISDFFNAPLLGAAVGAIIGLVPALHRAFFNSTKDGGIFTAWLTSSLRSIGGLFVPLPVVVAGVSLFNSWRDARSSGTNSRQIPWITVVFILVIRFVIWPLASISLIYALASKTNLLGSDPMLWFALMLMPTGPPAMKLITLVQVSNASEEDEKTIAELLTISYLLSPILSLTVVGSLRAAELAV